MLAHIKPTLKNADHYMLIMALTGLVGKHGKYLNGAEMNCGVEIVMLTQKVLTIPSGY